jgi:hypothetical protein
MSNPEGYKGFQTYCERWDFWEPVRGNFRDLRGLSSDFPEISKSQVYSTSQESKPIITKQKRGGL